jgi:hypothetical protein
MLKIHIGEYLYDSFSIQNDMKQEDALEYGIRKAQENQVGLKLNATHQLLVSSDDVNLLGDKIDIIIDASKEVGLMITEQKRRL